MSERAFTCDWVSHNAPRWREVLAHLVGRSNVLMLEVGSHEGRSACWFLDEILTGAGAGLVCVDTWGTEEPMTRFDANTREAQDEGRLLKLRGTSADVAALAAPGTVDAAYIDGDHTAEGALTDAVNVWPLLAERGVLIFDDYGTDEFPARAGIDAFLRCAGDAAEVLHVDYQLVVRRRVGVGHEADRHFRPCGMHGVVHVDGTICG